VWSAKLRPEPHQQAYQRRNLDPHIFWKRVRFGCEGGIEPDDPLQWKIPSHKRIMMLSEYASRIINVTLHAPTMLTIGARLLRDTTGHKSKELIFP